MKAEAGHRVQRRNKTNMAKAERAGARVRATLSETTGPNTQVTGARRVPTPVTPVLATRLTPIGNPRAFE